MKNPAWLGLVLLLAVSCRKELVVETPSSPQPAPVENETAPLRVGAPTAKLDSPEETPPENPRTRPLPRPEDRKHKPAPPVEASPMPTAVAVEDKPGFVYSPYNSKIIDVRDMPAGTLVGDPNFPPEEKKYFRVP
ncbi:MAG: hypothetical protein V4640_01510 [Verrucomicrobiota bacterium]